jgi:exonuclease SbcC
LFRTDRFERVERWLAERRLVAGRAADTAAADVRAVLHRVQEVAGADLPDGWADDLAAADDRGDVEAWSRELTADAESGRAVAEQDLRAAEAGLAVADERLAEVRRLHDLQARAESAAREIVELQRRDADLAGLAAAVDAHRRAEPLTAFFDRATECRRRSDRAATAWRAHRGVLGDPEDATAVSALAELLAERHRAAVAARAGAEAYQPRARELATLRARRDELVTQVSALTASLEALEAEAAGQPDAVAGARAALDEARQAAAELPAVQAEVAALEELQSAAARQQVVVVEVEAARADVVEALDATLTAKETYLAVREARINGMAAELAGALAAGCACPVCGSSSHPAPAHGAADPVGRAQEEAARKAYEDAAFVHQGQEVRLATLVSEVDALAARLAGVDTTSLPGLVRAGRERLRAARALASEVGPRAERVDDLDTQVRATAAARDRGRLELVAAERELTTVATAESSLSAELDALLDGQPDLDTLLALHDRRCGELEAAQRAFAAYDDAVRAADAAGTAARDAAVRAGFASADAAAEALLADDEVRAAQQALADAEALRIAAERVLADPATKAALAQDPPDLDVAVVTQRLAGETLRAATSALDAATTRAQRLSALDVRLRDQLAVWRPLREEHALLAGLSQLVEGKGPDNPMRIRLASYVLSERLRQVVAAANERLARMTGRRYSLEHTDDRGAGEQRGGLSLLVRDDWNGLPRDPATLSGGETFVVSLALALGLADTVAHEAGGTDIDTLFIDEGFGSLDADTLEDVMDTLDSLRDGGRVVGLVSHVPELRSRVTTQLEVLKGRDGSTVRAVLAAG